MDFQLVSKFEPAGDQPAAIDKIMTGWRKNQRQQTLLGVTGSGKTFTMANIIAQVNKPTLVISHNKTLTAQLASEFQDFFPHNAVHYFVSYYDYYQPEAYIPSSDTYIEKETQINEEIDRLRHLSTQSLLTRDDVIVVASVSCIYNLGSPLEYDNYKITLKVGQIYNRRKLLKHLNDLQYRRNDVNLIRTTYSVKGEVISIFASGQEDKYYRLIFFGEQLETIELVDVFNRQPIEQLTQAEIFPAKHFLTNWQTIPEICEQIRRDLETEVSALELQGKNLAAERLRTRVQQDLEMISQVGYCNGIENYARYFSGRQIGDPPISLLEYFPDDFLLFIDESHMTVPQIGGMYLGDKARKQNLVDFGFRLKAAYDNRPLRFDEFEKYLKQVIYVSATPAHYELEHSSQVVEQIIRPTFVLDPVIEVRPTAGQLDNLYQAIKKTIEQKQRVLITVLTKKLAEDATEIFLEKGIKVQYLHSEIKTLERLDILHDLRAGKYDVLIGVNLLREGLDLPEVALVVILDADKEGFLRSAQALIQVMGRAARHNQGKVIMYADHITKSMEQAISETGRRRQIQERYNRQHQVKPLSVIKQLKQKTLIELDVVKTFGEEIKSLNQKQKALLADELAEKMEMAAANWEFEKAIQYRDQLGILKKKVKLKEHDSIEPGEIS